MLTFNRISTFYSLKIKYQYINKYLKDILLVIGILYFVNKIFYIKYIREIN